jgi:peptidyl-prolyl cis-trans isomerase SurA
MKVTVMQKSTLGFGPPLMTALAVVASLAIAAPASLAQTKPASPPQIVEQVLVKVNGDIITKTELEERQIGALRERKVSPEVLKNDEQLKKALAEVTPALLVSAIDELLVIQLGREKGLRLSDEQFNRWLTSMRKDQGLEDDKRFEAALKQEGMTLTDIRRNVERQFLLSQVQTEEFGGKLQITEEEARQYYLANPKEFVDPATVTLREILVEVPTVMQQGRAMVSVGKDDEALKKAEAVRARLSAGEDFAAVAGEVSASASKANGGLIGPIATSELSPDLQKMLQGMKPGEITQPMRAAKGYQILKLETAKVSGLRPFDSVRDLVADRVYQDRSRTEMRKFIERVRRQAIIVWKNDELRKAYEQQVALMSTGAPGS